MFIAFGVESRSYQMHRRFVQFALVIFFMLLAFPFSCAAQLSKSTAQTDLGDLGMGRDHVKWPSPESLVENLRSQNEDLRSEGFLLLGAPAQAGTEVTDTSGTSDQVQLRYAARPKQNGRSVSLNSAIPKTCRASPIAGTKPNSSTSRSPDPLPANANHASPIRRARRFKPRLY